MATFIKKEAILDKSISTSKVQSGFLDSLISTLSKDKLKSTLDMAGSMWTELAANSGFFERLATNNNFVSMMATGSGLAALADNPVFQGRLASASFFGSFLGLNYALGSALAQNNTLASKLAENIYLQSKLGEQTIFLQRICSNVLIDSYGFTTAQYSQFANKSAFNEALAANSGFLGKLTSGIVSKLDSANLAELASKLSSYLSSYFISLNDGGGTGGAGATQSI